MKWPTDFGLSPAVWEDCLEVDTSRFLSVDDALSCRWSAGAITQILQNKTGVVIDGLWLDSIPHALMNSATTLCFPRYSCIVCVSLQIPLL